MGIGAKIKAVREALNMPQVRLADQANMSQQALHALEIRDSRRSVYFAAIARAFGVTLDDLLTLPADEIAAVASPPYEPPKATAPTTVREPAKDLQLYSTPGDRQNELLRLFDELTPPQQAQFLAELETQVKANRAIAAHYHGRGPRSVENERVEAAFGLPKRAR